MKFLKFLGIVLVVALVLLVAVPAFLSPTFHVDRSVTVDAPAAQVHRLVGDLAEWDRWTPWKTADPTIVTRVEVATGIGAHQTWTGKSGTGELTFTASDPATGIAYDMAFEEGEIPSTGTIRYEATAGGTKVTWSMDGTMPGWFGRYFALAMDRMVGPMFEDGLARLKVEAEALPPPAPDPASPDRTEAGEAEG